MTPVTKNNFTRLNNYQKGNLEMLNFKKGREEFRKAVSSDHLTIAVTGDVCPWGPALEPVKAGRSSEILKDIQPCLDAADLAIVQWETPLTNDNTPIAKSGPNLICPPECVDFALEAGFDVALLANNHIGDIGESPVLKTIEVFNRNGIKTAGAGKNIKEAVKPLIFEKNGFKIGIINVAEHEFGTAAKDKAGCAPLEPVDNLKVISDTAAVTDITLTIIHGGNEHNPFPSPRMIRTYRAFADAGSTAVINIHPHCPQGIELWNGVPIVYCPGNFFFPSIWQEFHPENFWWTGYIPTFSFDREGAFALEITPYMFTEQPCAIKPFAGRKKDAFCAYLAKISAIITDSELAGKYFDAWCAVEGPWQLRSIRISSALWPINQRDPEEVSQLLVLRNHFTCEAHEEVKNNFLRMLEEFRVEEAEKFIPEMRKLRKADFGPA